MAGNLLGNPDLELATGNNFDIWGENYSAESTITVNTTDPHSGTKCAEFYNSGTNAYLQQAGLDVEVGQEYTITFWAKSVSGGADCYISGLFAASEYFTLTTSWKKYSHTGIAASTTLNFLRYNDGTFLADDFRLEATPLKTAVIRGTVSADIASPDTDFTQTGFGTPKAALVFMCYGGQTSVADQCMSVGFYDGSVQYCMWAASESGLSTSECSRGRELGLIAKAHSPLTTEVAEYYASLTTDGITLTMETDNTTLARYVTVVLFGGADVQADVNEYTPNGTNGYQSNHTFASFRPDMVFSSSSGTNTTESTQCIMSFGAASRYVLSQCRGVFWFEKTAITTSDCAVWSSTTQMSGQFYVSNMDWSCDVSDWFHNGFQSQTTGTSGGDNAYALALKMPGVMLVVGDLANSATTGNKSWTGLGFKPQCLIAAVTLAASSNGSFPGIGVSLGAGNLTTESSHAIRSRDNVTTTNAACFSRAYLVDVLTASGGQAARASIVSFDDDGFTLNYDTATQATRGWYVAFADTDNSRKIPTTAGGNWLIRN